MVSTLSFRRVMHTLLATVATAAMFYFGNGLEPWWPLMWFAPLPVLLFALRAKWWTTAVMAVAVMMLGNLNMWSYFTKTLRMPGSAWVIIFLAAGVVFAAGVLLFRMLVLRGAVWSGVLALPAVWVASEYVRNITSPHGSAGSLAYSQLKFLPFLQLASITGPWGMTFVLLLFPAAIAIGLHIRQNSWKRALQVAGAGVGVVAAVLLFGAVRLSLPQKQMVKVGLITSDEKPNDTVTDPGVETERLFRDYAREAERLATDGAQAIVMPEKLGVTLEGKAAATDVVMQSVAAEKLATIVAGVVHVAAPLKYNAARIYVPGSVVQRYDKEHMLPPFESNLKPGTTLTVLPRPQQKWGVAICKDMDFASPARLYGKAGVGLMLVPGWDFVVDGSWHGHIAVMRGVEDGFSVARAAKNGFLTVSDNRGRIVGEVSSSSAPFATLLVNVPTAHGWTVYQLLGDWFAGVAIALLVFAMMQMVRLRGHAHVRDSEFVGRLLTTTSRPDTAERLRVREATHEVSALLKSVDVDQLLDPETWPTLGFFALIQPDGDTLPVRTVYGEKRLSGDTNIGLNPLNSAELIWFAGPDIVGSLLHTGKRPKILRAIRFEAVGVQKGLTPVKLGKGSINPAKDDFFRKVVKERKGKKKSDPLHYFLKILAKPVVTESMPRSIGTRPAKMTRNRSGSSPANRKDLSERLSWSDLGHFIFHPYQLSSRPAVAFSCRYWRNWSLMPVELI